MRPHLSTPPTRRAALVSAACALLAASSLVSSFASSVCAQPNDNNPNDNKPNNSATPSTPTADAPVVLLETSLGNITVRLDPERAPISVANFLSYVQSGFYNGTIFHRVISNFMIQGGGFTPEMTQKEPQRPITLEVGKGLSNLEGSIAMARTGDPNSATSQFFINVKNNRQLDTLGGGYAVFGQVIEGMDVVNKIRYVPTGSKGMHGDVPLEPVIIKSATRLK